MTLSSTTSRQTYAGDGATTAFPIPFLFLANDHIQAVLRDASGVETPWLENTHYTLSGAGAQQGGTLTVLTAPVDHTPQPGETLVIRRIVPATQETDYPEGGAFPAAAHETALDKLTMLAQQQAEQLGRALQFPVSDAAALSAVLPPSSSRAGKLLGFGAGGEPVAYAAPDASATSVTAAGTTTARLLADRFADVVNVKDFGARGDGVTDDGPAIQAAIDALPNRIGGTAIGGVPFRQGTVLFPPGTYLVSDSIKITSGTRLAGSGQYRTTIKLKDNSFTSTEKFVIEVLPSIGEGGTPSGTVTHGPELDGIVVDCNGISNSHVSGIRWWGAESNRILRCEISNFRKRGLVISDKGQGYTPGNSLFVDSIWINGLGAATEGPGLSVTGTRMFFGDVIVQHINHENAFTDVDGDPSPAILLDGAAQCFFGVLGGEGELLFLKIKNSVNNVFGVVEPYRPVALSTDGTVAIKITGDSYYNVFHTVRPFRFETGLLDNSVGLGFIQSTNILGNTGGHQPLNYKQHDRVSFLGIGGAPNPAYPLYFSGGISRFDASAGLTGDIQMNHVDGGMCGWSLLNSGAPKWQIRLRPDHGNAFQIYDTDNALSHAFRNGRLGLNTLDPQRRLHVVGDVRISGLAEYADNASAIAGGLSVGDLYQTMGTLKIVT